MADTANQILTPPQTPQYMLDAFGEAGQGIKEYRSFWANLVWPGLPVPVGRPDTNACDHILDRISIRSNGDVVPCCYDLVNKMPMGNINSEKLQDIWNNQRYQNLRRDIVEYNPPELCIGCPVLYKFTPMLKGDILKKK